MAARDLLACSRLYCSLVCSLPGQAEAIFPLVQRMVQRRVDGATALISAFWIHRKTRPKDFQGKEARVVRCWHMSSEPTTSQTEGSITNPCMIEGTTLPRAGNHRLIACWRVSKRHLQRARSSVHGDPCPCVLAKTALRTSSRLGEPFHLKHAHYALRKQLSPPSTLQLENSRRVSGQLPVDAV